MHRLMGSLAVVLLVATACGGGDDVSIADVIDDEASATASDSDQAAESSDTSDSDDASASSDSGDSGGDSDGAVGVGADTDFCQFVDRIDEDTDVLGDSLASLDPDGLRNAYSQVEDLIDQAVALAPGEIRDDVTFMARGFKGFNELLAEFDYDVFALFADPNAETDARLQEFDSEEFDAANARLDAFCGIAPDPVDSGTGDSGTGDSGGVDPGLDSDQATDIVVAGLQAAFGWDAALAGCVVDELGLDDPTAIDPSVFADMTREVCGQTIAELFGG